MIERIARYLLSILLQTTPSIFIPSTGKIGVCSLCSHDHCLYLLCTLKSFLHCSKLNLPITIIDDGTLKNKDKILIRKHFPGIKIVDSTSAYQKTIKLLSRYPMSKRFRQENDHLLWKHNVKLFDPFLLSEYKKIVYIDSDVLFYDNPLAIKRWINSNRKYSLSMGYLNRDIRVNTSYFSKLKGLSNLLNLPNIYKLNSGIICMHSEQFNLRRVEKYISFLYKSGAAISWYSEQLTLSLLLFQPRYPVPLMMLDPYRYLVGRSISSKKRIICIHYNSADKRYFSYDAIMNLLPLSSFNKLPWPWQKKF